MRLSSTGLWLLVCLAGACAPRGLSSPPLAPGGDAAILLRGWLGAWSNGLDAIAEDLRAEGWDARIVAHTQWSAVADELTAAAPGRVVIIGHSFGADDGIRLCQRLGERGVAVDLLIAMDAVNPPPVPGQVRRAQAFYVSQGWRDRLPWWRGVPLAVVDAEKTELTNTDVRDDPALWQAGTAHDTIDELPGVRARTRQAVGGLRQR